ncbi:MAG: hypothetical protein ACFFAO_20330, partial [Candidatus Hermodarchaeota archaeon]
NGFGTIFLANQIHYLHSNLFNYFQNIISFRTTDIYDVKILKNQMNLQELRGTGYYGSNRNNTYQIEYLMRMNENEILIKRSDIYQPFPAVIDNEQILKTKPMKCQEIIKYMDERGYDLQFIEQEILEQTKETIFEKDFTNYSMFLEEIIKFLNALRVVDKVGNLYKSKIKEELKKVLYSKAIKITKDKKKIKKLRDEIFNIFVKFGYLVENHPKMASGAESIRTSYSVGEKFQIALNDYIQNKNYSLKNLAVKINEQISESELVYDNTLQESSNPNINTINRIKNLLAMGVSDLYYDLFLIHKSINKDDYEQAIEIEKEFIKKFLTNLHKNLFHANYNISDIDLESFSEYLSKNKILPYTKEQIINYLSKCDSLDVEKKDLESQAINTYNLLSDFFNHIQVIINES